MNTKIFYILSLLFGLAPITVFAQTNFTASSAQQYSLKQLNTSISGSIVNPSAKILELSYYKNNLSFKSETLVLPVSDKGTFKVDFDLNQDIEIRLSYGGQRVPLFVQQGDDLKLNFDGNQFLGTLTCAGRGGYNNQYLVDSARKFSYIDLGYILYEIAQKDNEDFKKFLDKILDQKNQHYRQYDNAVKSKMTPSFKQYIAAEYRFWHANELLNYRTEKPLLTGKAAPMDLPASYFTFLEKLDLNTSVMLSNRNYCEFLEEFLKYKGEQAAIENELNYAIKIVDEENMLFGENGGFIHLNVGEKVAILDEGLSFSNRETIARFLPAFEAKMLDFVKLENGTKGWVGNLSTKTVSSEDKDGKSEQRIKKYAVNKMYNAKLYENPGSQENVTGALGYGEEVKYLHLKTSESFAYYHQGLAYYGKLVQVENSKNERGWILESFIEVKEKKVSSKEVHAAYLYSLTDTSEARQYLSGEPLYYTLAKALYWKVKLNKSPDVAREIAAFASHNDYKVLNDVLRAEYDVEQLRKKSNDDYIETYAYSNLKSPVIEGVKIGLPFDKAAFVRATRSQSEKEYVDISCELSDRSSSAIQIKGNISGGHFKEVSLSIIYDFISYQEEDIPLTMDAQGNYNFTTDLKDPVLAYLQCGDKSLELYLYPGDKIDIDFDANNFPNSVHFDGKSAQLNNFLFEEKKVFGHQFENIAKQSELLSPDDFAGLTKGLHKKRIQYFEKYKKRNGINSQDDLFIRSNIHFSYATMMFNYEDTQQYIQKVDKVALSKNFYAFLEDLPYSVEGVLPNVHYVDFIHQFLDYQSKRPGSTNLNKMEIAKQYFKGEVLAFINAKELATMCQLGKAFAYGKPIADFIAENTYDQYNDVLRVVYNENKPIQIGDSAPDFTLSDIDGNQVQLSDLKGKVVYIDFWATWCRPCIKSMAYSQRLIEKYKSKDVEFLYVSMDENTKAWEGYVASQNLQGLQLNAMSGSGYLSDIARLYKVRQLPTFVIIDKDGKIAFNKAGSPGNAVVSDLIDGLLETPRF